MSDRKRISVVLFNLGGPDKPAAVEPFLFNLFNDPAIIELPGLFRWLLAKLVSKRRAPIAREIYKHLGGSSPLLPLTQDQAAGLKVALSAQYPSNDYQIDIAMRYWHPFADETAKLIKVFDPDMVVLLPLYPQFSKTTSGSSFIDFEQALDHAKIGAKRRTVCCYPTDSGVIDSHVDLITESLKKVPDGCKSRILFSAHGLPKKVIEGGDPYQWQVEQTADQVVSALAIADLDWTVCYQSRVGPLEWIGPSTEAEIERAGQDGVALIVVPIAFVSEHSETLVELDIEYGELAHDKGVETYIRVPALGTSQPFIDGLAKTVIEAVADQETLRSSPGPRLCPHGFTRCPHKGEPCGQQAKAA